jgi:hypothetical protein
MWGEIMGKKIHDWEQIKKEYMMGYLSLCGGIGLSLKELADKYHIPVNVVWNRSYKEKWKKEAEEAKKEKEAELIQQLQKSIVEIDSKKLLDEVKVRSENFQMATMILDKLVQRWSELTEEELKKLSPAELIKGMQTCLKARAEAAGLPKIYNINSNNLNVEVNPDYRSPAENRARVARNHALADDLEAFMMADDDEDL